MLCKLDNELQNGRTKQIDMKKRITPTVHVGPIRMGGRNPIVIQSMTNTDTSDVEATVAQALELISAGAQVIRMTVNNEAAAQAVSEIKKRLTEHFAASPPPEKGELEGVFFPYEKELTTLAQKNRQNPTEAEKKLWNLLSRKQFQDLKFTRQKPILSYIVDFYCSSQKLVIEVDGDSHADQVEYDKKRTIELEELGLRVIRYSNNEVLNNLEGVYEDLLSKLNPPQSPLLRGEAPAAPNSTCIPSPEKGKLEGVLPFALVGDFHFNGNKLLKAVPACAKALDKYRINPGNADDTNFKEMVEIAVAEKKAVRIGVNGGSLDSQVLDEMMDLNAQSPTPLSAGDIFVKAMVKSALNSAKLAESYGLAKNQIVVSVKISEVNQVVSAYKQVAEQSDYCLHLGLTEAGSGLQGVVQSSIALGILLNQNIGDTIRVSLTPNKNVPRSEEVEVCKQILQSLDLQRFRPKVISCPGCGRTTSTFFQDLALRVNNLIDQKLLGWKRTYPGVENLNIAVMGCVVNGPGESKNADIAISLPGKMEKAQAPVYIDGELDSWLKGDDIENQFIQILEGYIKQRF